MNFRNRTLDENSFRFNRIVDTTSLLLDRVFVKVETGSLDSSRLSRTKIRIELTLLYTLSRNSSSWHCNIHTTVFFI